MNYQAHYDRLIERARSRVLDGYSERHHVAPVCMGGSDEAHNLVRLTPEEHYVAHQLLYRIHKTRALFNAVKCMTWKSKTTPTRSNRLYGWIRRQHAAYMSAATKGRKLSEETKRKIGAANAVSQRGKKQSDAHKAAIGNAHRGSKRSEETKQRMSRAQTGLKRPPMTEDAKRKHSVLMSATRWWNNGEVNRRAAGQPGPDFVLGQRKMK